MFRRLASALLLTTLFLLAPVTGDFSFSQEVRAPRDIEKLLGRVQEYWRFLASGQRLKAAEFVVAEKREHFLSGQGLPVVQVRIEGVDFTPDPNRGIIRIALKLMPIGAVAAGADWVIHDNWVWQKNNWYADVQELSSVFKDKVAGPSQEMATKELDTKFRLPQMTFDIGRILQGERKIVDIPVEYSGEATLRIEPQISASLGLVEIDAASAMRITAKSKSFKVIVGSNDIEGPFALPVGLFVVNEAYKVSRTITIKGEVFAPFSFKQTPDVFRNLPGEDLVVTVTNNNDEPVFVRKADTDGKFDVLSVPENIEPKATGILRLKRRTDVAEPAQKIGIVLLKPIHGREIYEFRLRTGLKP